MKRAAKAIGALDRGARCGQFETFDTTPRIVNNLSDVVSESRLRTHLSSSNKSSSSCYVAAAHIFTRNAV